VAHPGRLQAGKAASQVAMEHWRKACRVQYLNMYKEERPDVGEVIITTKQPSPVKQSAHHLSDPSKLSYNHNEDLRNRHSGSNIAPELANPSQSN
jgi:hypothetical protein